MQAMKPWPNRIFAFIWHYVKQHLLAQVGLFIVALSWAIELTLSPYLMKRIIDVVARPHSQNLISHILWPCLLYAAMSLWMNLNFRLCDYINLTIYPAIKKSIGQDMFNYLMSHSYTFFQNNFAGTLTKKIFDMCTNVEKIIQIFTEWFYPRVFALLIASISMMLIVKPIFGLILLLWTILYTALSFMGVKWIEKSSHTLSTVRAKMSGTISDSISNIMLTKLFSNARHESSRINNSLNELSFWDRKVGRISLLMNFLQGLMVVLLTGSMLFFLVYIRQSGGIQAGDFVFVLTLSMFITNIVWQIGTQMLEFSKALGECRQAMSYMIEPHGIQDVNKAQPLTVSAGRIAFNNVNFSYNNTQPLFHQLNVTIEPGQRVGLVGHSGGGKSSFVKLILRLVDIQSGTISIDGQNIQTVQQQSLRQQISSIPQETELFHRSIFDNIRFAKPDATEEDVIQAAKQAHCHEFIITLPQGYQSLVGERGVKLSGGQKQRISIARAFLKNSSILLIDEATSALDSKTEQDIQQGLHKIMTDKTVIVVAHRLSTLKNMERILVFDHGSIIQDGTLTELMSDKTGYFHALCQMQSNGFLAQNLITERQPCPIN